MKLKTPITSITTLDSIYDMAASVRGTGVLTGSGETLNLPNVTNNIYTTILSNSYRVEDVGFIETLSMFVSFGWNMLGNGQWRWQISGDGGTTWVTVADITTNESPFQVEGAGTWISSIQTGDDKFQVRFQARAVTGTVSTAIFDVRISGLADSFITLIYEKRDKVT